MALTEVATFLYTDLVGSTAVSTAEEHGDAELERRAGALLARARP